MSPQAEALAATIAKLVVAQIGERRPLFSPRSLASFLAISERTARDLIAAGTIRSVKVGGSRRITAQAVDEYLERLQRETP